MEVVAKAKKWLASEKLDQETRNGIQDLLNAVDQAELTECFYRDLEFGTGGLRGIMGVGSNRVNKYTVGMATQGLANYLIQSFPGKSLSVAIAYDSRNNSRFFAEITANVFSANDIKVYLFKELRPTPELSFSIRELGCQSGVVLTASHNPKEYNGYKAYWSDGAQLVPPHDKNVIKEVEKITSIDEVLFEPRKDLIHLIGDEIDEKYIKSILNLSLSPDAIKKQHDLSIVFSSIHGTGITLVPKVLERMGFSQVSIVEEQAEANGNFPTVVYPNPEEAEAMSLALKKASAIDAELVMATDPDSDRVGIAVKNDKGEFQLLNGNQTATMLLYYLLKKWKDNGKLDGNQYVVKTIVTTDIIERMARHFGVKCYDTLTGFKYIAEVIRELEGKATFIGGGEESYGYLIGDKVRDKDAIASCAMIAEMAAWAKNEGIGLYNFLKKIYAEFGFFHETLKSITRKGQQGAAEIRQMMVDFRNNPPQTLAGSRVVKVIDYLSGEEKDLLTGKSGHVAFPKSDVLQFFTEDHTKVSVRPSGTEPKIKFYFSVTGELTDPAQFDSVQEKMKEKVAQIVQELNI